MSETSFGTLSTSLWRASSCFALLALAWLGQGLNADASSTLPAHTSVILQVGGTERHALLPLLVAENGVKPSTQPTPLVVMPHGHGSTSVNAVRETRWSDRADAERFVVVYPDAARRRPFETPSLRHNPQAWNDGSGRFHPPGFEIDNVEFIRSLINQRTGGSSPSTRAASA